MQYVRKREEHTKQLQQIKAVYEQTSLQSKIEIQEQTLRGISHEIHDNIGQILSLVSLNLNTIVTNDQEKLESTAELVEKAVTDLRGLSKSINPDRIIQVDLYQSLQNDLQYIERTKKFTTDFYKDVDFPDFDVDKRVIIYRIIQELINNCIKHSKATKLTVSLLFINDLPKIIVEDNGIGFDTTITPTNGLGLQTILYRVSILNANMQIISSPNNGTKISLILKKV